MTQIKPVTPEARALADRVIEALEADELIEGYDLTAGMFGTQFSQLLIELSTLSAELRLVRDQKKSLERKLEEMTNDRNRWVEDHDDMAELYRRSRSEIEDLKVMNSWRDDNKQWGP